MSSGPETRFYRSIHKLLPPSVYRVKMSNPYVGGIPDCWYSGVGGDLWIEFKYGKNGISALQQDWIVKRRAEGRKVWIITGNKEGGTIQLRSMEKHAQYTKAEIAQLIIKATTIESSSKVKRNSKRK